MPPTIVGSPPRSTAPGEIYEFTPAATDPEGQVVSFSISGKPHWASFSAKTGRLRGEPTAADVGTYANVTIVVSDGTNTDSLPAFDIAVNSRGEASVTLSWTPPTENNDGSVLTDLAGYRIHYGRNPHALNRSIELGNPGLTRYVIEGLASAKWYFAMSSVDRKGNESHHSEIVSKNVS